MARIIALILCASCLCSGADRVSIKSLKEMQADNDRRLCALEEKVAQIQRDLNAMRAEKPFAALQQLLGAFATVRLSDNEVRVDTLLEWARIMQIAVDRMPELCGVLPASWNAKQPGSVPLILDSPKGFDAPEEPT